MHGQNQGNSEIFAHCFGAQLRHKGRLHAFYESIPNAELELSAILQEMVDKVASADTFQFSDEGEFCMSLYTGMTNEEWSKFLEEANKQRIASLEQNRERREKERREKEALMQEMSKLEDEYVAAGLGSRMPYYPGWPVEAKNYPGGPVAVYKEAIEKHLTWEEVCGWKLPPIGPGTVIW